MSSKSSTTLSLSTRVSALEGDMADIKASVQALVTALVPTTKAAPKASKKAEPKAEVTKARKTGARKTPNRKPVANGTVAGARCLVRGNRAQFVADHDWATAGMSVKALAEAVLVEGKPLTGSWAIGPRRAESITGSAKAVTGPSVKAGKKGKKGKGKKGTKTTVQAVVEPSAPAKTLTPAQQERVDAPRDALGRVTPKVEWTLRQTLAESGKYDRHEIDARVKAARDAGVFA